MMMGQIVSPMLVPIIDCGSNSTTITFSWPDVAGASGYQVDVLEGNTGMMVGPNSYEVGGLQAGDSVTIELIVLTDGPCGVVSVQTECFAQDCAAQVLNLTTPQDSFCIDPSLGTIMLNASVDSGDAGVFTFSGPGIVNAATGEFDPNVAGVGTHNVRVDFLLPDGCKFNKSTTIRVFAIPVNDINLTNDTICINSFVNVNYSGGTTGVSHDWTFNDAMVNSGNAGGPYNLTWATVGNKEVSLVVERNNCESDIVSKNIEVEPLLLAPVLDCSNTLNSVSFSWGAVANSSGYNITVLVNGVQSFAGLVTDLNYDELGLNPDDEVMITVQAVSENSCPATMASRTCFANACNPITLSFPDDMVSLCLDPSSTPIVLDYTVNGGNGMGNGNPTWTGTGVVNGTFDPSIAGEGTFVIDLLYEEGVCTEMNSLTFEVTETPVTDFTIDNSICIANTATVTTLSTSGSMTSYTWPSEASVNDMGNGVFELTFSQPGTYTVEAMASKGACDGDIVTNNIIVEAELDPIVFSSCISEVDMVSFSWTAIDCATDYEVIINGVSQGTQTGTSFDVDMLSEGDQVDIEVIAISDCVCGNVSAIDMCTAQNCPPISIDLTPQNNDICLYSDVTPFQIDLVVSNGSGAGSGVWSGTGVDANGMFDPSSVGPGSYMVTYNYEEGICAYDNSVMINIFDVPEVDVDFVNPDCYDEIETEINVISMGGDSNYSYVLDGNSIGSIVGLTADEGSHTLEITDGNGCSNQTTFSVVIPSQPSAPITGTATLQTTQQGNYSINPSALAGLNVDQIIWYVDGVEVCNAPDCFGIDNQSFTGGAHEVSVEILYNDGCRIADQFDVSVDDVFVSVVTIPNIISPNNDSNNNIWSIHSNETIVINYVQVFDRWGTLLFDFKGPVVQEPSETVVSWDGKYEGKFLQPGVYVYSVSYVTSFEEVIRAGDITIIR
jgi:gliding motility-associated-like protein